MNAAKREEIFSRLRSLNPEPATELHYRTPFELLVAVVLSAQATDKSVNLVTPRLFAAASSPAAMLALGTHGTLPVRFLISFSKSLLCIPIVVSQHL